MPRPVLSPILFVCVVGTNSLGSNLTAFGLAAWIFHITGSYDTMAMLGIITPLTVILFAPIAGVAADRYEKRIILITADIFSILSITLSLVLYLYGLLSISLIMVLSLCLSSCNEFRYTASASLIPTITEKGELLKVNSIQQVFRGSSLVLGPLLGALGFNYLGLPWLLSADVLTFFLSVSLLVIFAIIPAAYSRKPKIAQTSLISEVRQALLWLSTKPPLVALLFTYMLINALLSIFMVALSPYVLAVHSSMDLGLISSAIGVGMFLSGFLLSRVKKCIRPVIILVFSIFVLGLSFIAVGIAAFRESLWLLTPFVGASVAALVSSNQTIWHSHTPPDIQGKIIALRSMVMYLMTPVSILISAPLVSRLLTPIITQSHSASELWGEDLSGALGLMISLMGAVLLVLGTFALLSKKVGILASDPDVGP